MAGLEDLQLPPGYSLDVSHDPDAPHLRRPDGWPVVVFGPGASREVVERLAWADYHARPLGQTIACFEESEDVT